MEYKSDFSLKDITEFLPATITQVYGAAASGKSNVCLLATVNYSSKGKVVYIDTEGSFSTERIKQMAGKDFDKIMKNIIIAKPTDFDEQKVAINKIEDILIKDKISLIVIDSLVSHYRLEMGNSEDPYALNRELGKQLAKLFKLSSKHEVPVIITNQVYTSFEKRGRESITVPVGRDLLKYWAKVIIALEKGETRRKATLIRHKFKPEGLNFSFDIENKGLK